MKIPSRVQAVKMCPVRN